MSYSIVDIIRDGKPGEIYTLISFFVNEIVEFMKIKKENS